MRRSILPVAILFVACWLGCSKSSNPSSNPAPGAAASPAQSAAKATAQPSSQALSIPANAPPEQVVTAFLQALRTGDSATAESLLTGKARVELAKHQVHVDVQSAPSATYLVEQAQYFANQPAVANVNSQWTEKYEDEQGQPKEEKYVIVWGLRQQPEGWRVAGMQMELIPGQPQLLDFENPSDMLKKKEEAMAALQAAEAQAAAAAAANAAAQTAQQPQALPGQQPPTIER
jgi:hypothetical protein